MNNRTYKLMFFGQPLGDFAITTLPIQEIMKIYRIDRRSKFENGIQRDAVQTRLSAIAKYVDTKDYLCFPTPILLSLPNDTYMSESNVNQLYTLNNDTNEITFLGENFASVIDGQHRILGIARSDKYNSGKLHLEIPVIFIIDPTIETSALIFSTINGNQRPVPYSIVADLFGLQTDRTPEKTAHEIVLSLNKNSDSPFHNRIKMLGKREHILQTLSQGPFVKILVSMMDNERKLFYNLYQKKEDQKILQFLTAYFKSVKDTYPSEWDNPNDYVLTRSVGLQGLMKALPSIFKYIVVKNEMKSIDYDNLYQPFLKYFTDLNDSYAINLSIKNIESNMRGANQLRDLLLTIAK